MRDVFVVADNIFSPIGSTTGENIANLERNISGVQLRNNQSMSTQPFYASLFEQDLFSKKASAFTKFEQLLVASVSDALKTQAVDPRDPKVVFILSTTKG